MKMHPWQLQQVIGGAQTDQVDLLTPPRAVARQGMVAPVHAASFDKIAGDEQQRSHSV